MEIKKGKTGPKTQYDPTLKRKVCEELLSGKTYLREVARKYNIKSPGNILTWLKKYEEEQSLITANSDIDSLNQPIRSEDTKMDQQSLEETLRLAQLKILGLEAMIDIAEQAFKIDIGKKCGTKPSVE